MQAFEGEYLDDILYYTYKNAAAAGTESPEWLFAILFVAGDSALLVSTDEYSEALRVLNAAELQEVVAVLGQSASIRRIAALQQGLWAAIPDRKLLSVQLSRHVNGLYRNDAVLLEFSTCKVMLCLNDGEGMRLQVVNG